MRHVALALGFGLATSAAGATRITVKGSDTMIVLAQRWAEVYQNKSKDVTIQVTGGGSGTGIAALINGTTDIANASRPITAAERTEAHTKGYDVFEYKVALDGLSVVVNRQSPVTALTMRQVMGIYVGAYNNWKEVGGKDQPILRYGREANSGTYLFFKEHVLLGKDFAPDCQTLPGTSAVAEAVARDPKAIGYGGVAYFITRPELRVVPIKRDDRSPAISPVTADGKGVQYASIYDESYPLARYLYCYTLRKPEGAVKTYIDWILGPEGQKIVEREGYVPLRAPRASE